MSEQTENITKNLTEKEMFPFQGSKIEFTFTQNDNGWWTTDLVQQSKRSLDGEKWEIAEITAQVVDKDTNNAIVTCWGVVQGVLAECQGNLFEYEHSNVYTLESNEEVTE